MSAVCWGVAGKNSILERDNRTPGALPRTVGCDHLSAEQDGTPPVKLSTVVKLIIASLIVGLLLDALGITPLGFWSWIADTAAGVWAWLARTLDWALLYILVGASIVLPLYLLRQFLRRRRS